MSLIAVLLLVRHTRITEWPITAGVGSNRVVGTNPERILVASRDMIRGELRDTAILLLWDGRAAERIIRILCERLPGS